MMLASVNDGDDIDSKTDGGFFARPDDSLT